MRIDRFEDVEGWNLGRELTRGIYSAVARNEKFSKDFGLNSQITRAAGSIMHNIAEGFDAGSTKEFLRFLGYSKRSCTEVQSELYVALDQHYISKDQFHELYELARETRNVVFGLMRYLKTTLNETKNSEPRT